MKRVSILIINLLCTAFRGNKQKKNTHIPTTPREQKGQDITPWAYVVCIVNSKNNKKKKKEEKTVFVWRKKIKKKTPSKKY